MQCARGVRVEGVTEASLTSDVLVACLFQHSCKGLAGLVREFASFETRNHRTGLEALNLGRAGISRGTRPPTTQGGGRVAGRV